MFYLIISSKIGEGSLLGLYYMGLHGLTTFVYITRRFRPCLLFSEAKVAGGEQLQKGQPNPPAFHWMHNMNVLQKKITFACVYVYIYMCACVCVCVCVCMYIYIYMCVCVFVCVYIYICVCVCVCMCIYIIYVYLCIYDQESPRTHTHTQLDSRPR